MDPQTAMLLQSILLGQSRPIGTVAPQAVGWYPPYQGTGDEAVGGYSSVSGATGYDPTRSSGVYAGQAAPAAGKPRMSAADWMSLLGNLSSQSGGKQERQPVQIQVPDVAPYQTSGYNQTMALIQALFGADGGQGGGGGGYGY